MLYVVSADGHDNWHSSVDVQPDMPELARTIVSQIHARFGVSLKFLLLLVMIIMMIMIVIVMTFIIVMVVVTLTPTLTLTLALAKRTPRRTWR